MQPMEIATRWKQKQYLETHPKGCKQSHKMGVFAIFCKKSLKRSYCEEIYAPQNAFPNFLFVFISQHLPLATLWYTLFFFLGAVLEEKFAKQKDHFEDFLYSNVLVKYYGIQWLLEGKIFLKKPPLLAVSFTFMT